MIYVNCPMKQDYVAELVEGITEYRFTLKEKKGIQIIFETDCEDDAKAIALVKSAIKATDIGKVLYFNVESK